LLMTKTDEKDRKKLSLSSGGTLSLGKKIETSQVKQSFSHGRSKTVQVERRRKRVAAVQKPETAILDESAALKHLTSEERAARTRALKEGLQQQENQEAEASLIEPEAIVEDDKIKEHIKGEKSGDVTAEFTEEQTPIENQEHIEAREQTFEDEQKILEAARLAEEEEARQAKATSNRQLGRTSDKTTATLNEDDIDGAIDEEGETPKTGKKRNDSGKKIVTPAGRRGEPRRRHSGKLTISQALDDSGVERVRSLASVRRAREKEKKRAREEQGEIQKQVRDVVVPDAITVQELANRMAERAADVIKKLMELGVMATINQVIDADTAELVTGEFGHKVRRVSESDVETGLKAEVDSEESKELRAPVVTIMGHVDHGKTSLLDAMRKTDVVTGEAGGITQHIGAYQIRLETSDKITFLDTPGHAAFTEMRARGANVTDIIVLVVAADDGINDQTVEAIKHAKAAESPIIIAINKIDLPDADPNRVQTELLQHEIVVEELGGDVIQVQVSAKTGQGIDKLQEAILLQAEILELKANPHRSAAGTIVEAKVERGKGSVATVLVQHGTLCIGDIFVAGAEWGRVRALLNDRGERINDCGPSFPAEVLGLNGSPIAGDDFVVVENESRAREVVEYRQREIRKKQASAGARGTVEQMLSAIAAGHADELPILIKTDVHGSLEAIRTSLERVSNDTVAVRILHGAVGGISESDVTLAVASKAIIVGFNVRANPQARELARTSGVDIRYYSIIYNVIDDIKAALTGLLSPDLKEEFLGNAEIKEVFNISKVGKIAGCIVTEGSIKRGAQVRLLRDNVVVHEGSLKTLKHFKEEVKDIREGSECGAGFENYNDLQVGDFIECFEIKEIARTLESVQNEANAS